MKLSTTRVYLQVALLYALFGSLWILLSDRLLATFVTNISVLTVMQTYKGWAFVLFSTLLIVLLLRRYLLLSNVTESQLRESEERFARAFLSSPVGLTITRLSDGCIVEANNAFLNITGYARDEVLGRTTSELRLLPAESRDQYLEMLRQKGNVYNFEFVFTHRSGTQRHLLASAETILLKGKPHLLSTALDITERKQTEETLRESEERYRLLFETSIEAMLLTSPDGGILDANPEACRLFGYSLDELKQIGRTGVADINDPRLATALEERKRTGKFRGELALLRKDGTKFESELSTVLFRNQDGAARTHMVARDITERKRAQEHINTQLRRMESLHTIDVAIANILDVRIVLKVVVEAVVSQLGVDAASVLLFRPANNMLEFAAGQGFRTKSIERGGVRLGEGFAGRAALERQRVYIPNLAEIGNQFTRAPLFTGESFISYAGVPLLAKGEIKGVLEVFHRAPLAPDDEWFSFLETIVGQAAVAIESAQAFEGLQHANLNLSLAYDATIEGWSRAMDLRDKETEGHTQRVTELTVELARAMGVSENKVIHMRRGALLHDMGKLGVPDTVLLKPDQLNEEEWAIMRQHPQFAYDMLSPIAYLRPALDIPYCHHEKWDGTGYPRGLKGEEIPIAARLFAAVDVWDALTSDRPYRKGWSKEKTLDYIRKQAGIHFDPKVVDEFLRLIGGRAEK